MKLSELIQGSGRSFTVSWSGDGLAGSSVDPFAQMSSDPEITRITDDSRCAGPGVLFAGTRNGQAFLEDALGAGASVILLSSSQLSRMRGNTGAKARATLIQGKRRPDFELGHLSSAFYGHPSRRLHLTAVTGTNGKTTTTHMLYHLWKKAGFRSALIGTLGVLYFDGEKEVRATTGFTTPRSYELYEILARLVDAGITHVAMEASSEALSLGRLEGLNVDTALFTGFGRDHLDYHGSMGAYLRSKMHLFFLTVRQKSPAFFVYREPTAEDTLKRFARLVLQHRLNAKASARERRLTGDPETGHDFHWINDADLADPVALRQPAPTRFNRINGLLAIRAAERSGVPAKLLDLSDFPGVAGRMEHVPLADGVDAFVDYAHSPDSLDRVLSELREIGYAKIIVIFGCGGDRDPGKRPLMGEISAKLADVMIVTDDNPRTEDPAKIRSQIIQGANGLEQKAELFQVDDRSQAIRLGVELALKNRQKMRSSGKVVLIVAGKGHEDYQIIGKEKHHFSDREEIQKSLAVFRFRP